MVADFETGAEAAARARPARTRCPTSSASPTRRRRASRWRCRAHPGARAGPSTATCACAAARGGCMVIAGWEGERESVARRRAVSPRILRSAGAVALGRDARARPGSTAATTGPYLRDELMDLGYLVETLETAHTWTRLQRALRAPSATRCGSRSRPAEPRAIVMCHLSHAYRDGASLYFTFISPAAPGRGDRAVARGEDGGVRGDRRDRRDHHPPPRGRPRPRSVHARGGGRRSASTALRAFKERLDPTGVMNPGKLLP